MDRGLLENLWEYLRIGLVGADLTDWLTVAAYACAVVATCRAAATAASQQQSFHRRFWMVASIALVALAINEIFDFQRLVTIWGKAHAEANGWYEARRTVQLLFTVGVAAVAAMAAAFGWWITRKAGWAIRFALLGFLSIAVFVLFRAASFHHVDQVLGSGVQAFNLGNAQELAGIVVIGLAALRYRTQNSRRG